jgi:CheY-like chemotaxis protein/HPt (histidine-containing phosphotransfer) domain-containing protein
MTNTHKILIVDDNIGNQKLVSLFIKSLGYEFDFASDGKEAVDLCINNDYGLVFMDQFMPVMNGTESASIIKKRNKNIPVIAFSADSDIKCTNTLGEVIFDDFLPKPYNKASIQNIIAKWLNNKPADSLPHDKIVADGNELVFDYSYIVDNYLKISNIDAVKKILLDALDEIKERILNLSQGNTVTELCTTFHTVKGVAGLLGGNRLYKLAQFFEDEAKVADTSFDSGKAINSIKKETELLEEAVLVKMSELTG